MYHQLLWSKELPNGDLFDLSIRNPGHYLLHKSIRGEFSLASDGMIPSYRNWKRAQELIVLIDETEIAEFQRLAYTIGGSIVFPRNRVDRKMTINGARGISRAISDRFDLTLECIRRHYLNEVSPLTTTLNRYRSYFDLFETFDAYVNFFELQDMVKGGQVRFFLPFEDFTEPAIPSSVSDYYRYMSNAKEFLVARGIRLSASR